MDYTKLSKRQQERFADQSRVFAITAIGPNDAYKDKEPGLVGKLVTNVSQISDWRDGWIGCICTSMWDRDPHMCFHQVKLRRVKNAKYTGDSAMSLFEKGK